MSAPLSKRSVKARKQLVDKFARITSMRCHLT